MNLSKEEVQDHIEEPEYAIIDESIHANNLPRRRVGVTTLRHDGQFLEVG
jgi:hypothetical protein